MISLEVVKKWVYSVFIVLLFLGVGQSIALEKQAIGTDLINAGKVLDDAGIKINSIDDVKYVDDYLKKNPKAKVADEIADAGGFGKWKSVANAGGAIFKAGDNIAGKVVVQVKAGTNGKIAVIGRKMDGHVNDVVSNLQSQGKQVEAFNDAFQSGKSFNIDGTNYSWQKTIDDFENINGQYATNNIGRITDEALPNTLMYKANQKWAQKLIDDGYEIIDIGYPTNMDTPSLFYNMELNTIFP